MLGRLWWLLNYCFWSRVYDAQLRKRKEAREYGETLAREAENPGPIPRLVKGEEGSLSSRSSVDVRAAGTSGIG